MQNEPVPRIAAVALGEPLDLLTWSGTSAHFLQALAKRGALVGSVSATSSVIEHAEKLAAASRSREVWRQKYQARASLLAPVARSARARLGAFRISRLGSDVDTILQFGGWYDFSRRLRAPVLRCSYHDGNLATYLARPDLFIDSRSRAIGRAWRAERRLYDGLDLITVMSDWVRASFIDDFEQDERKVVTVRAGANLAAPDELRRDFSRPRLLFVGKAGFARKGGPEILAAFRRLRAQVPEAEMWLVGPEGGDGGEAGIRYFGRILRTDAEGTSALDRIYRQATVFVMPSRYEPFGIAFLEAMAYRLPCIGARCCAMPEIIEDGVTGYLVDPGDVDALVERLLALSRDPHRAEAMGEAGHRRFVERYSWDRVAERLTDEISRRL